jgi:hypothetical protein
MTMRLISSRWHKWLIFPEHVTLPCVFTNILSFISSIFVILINIYSHSVLSAHRSLLFVDFKYPHPRH